MKTACANSREQKSTPKKVLNIDYSLCQGCAGCSDAYPQFFELRGERAWVINADQFDAVKYRDIPRVCPYYAITIENA